MFAMGDKGVALPLSGRTPTEARVRDLIKANEVVNEIKQQEDFTLTYHVLDLPSCGLIGVSDASLGGVGRFGYPTDQDSKTVKVYSQAGIGIFIGKKSLASQESSTYLNLILARAQVCIARAWLQKLVVWVSNWTQCFYGDLLSEILGESAPSCKKLHLKQNSMEWSKIFVTDARDVYDKVSTEKEDSYNSKL